MSTPRQVIAAALQADNPEWRVQDFSRVPENVSAGHPHVTVLRVEVNPGASPLSLEHVLQVIALGSRTVGAELEAELDDVLDGVLLTVERLGGFQLRSAKRGTFHGDRFHGWTFDLSGTSTNVYRDEILREKSNGNG